MSEMESDSLALTPGTEALIDSLLRQVAPQRLSQPSPPTAAVLVRYLSNALAYGEARQVEQGLTVSTESRKALREVRGHLDRLQALSWSEASGIANGDSREAETARAWLALAEQTAQPGPPELADPPSAPADAWAEVKQQAEAGKAPARALWTLFFAFGAQLQTQMRRPVVALARSRATTLPVYGTWKGECHLSESKIDAEGALHVSAVLKEVNGLPAVGFSGWKAYLALRVGGEAMLCAVSVLEGAAVSWTAQEIGVGLGQRSAAFPACALAILLRPPDLSPPPLPSLVAFSRRLLNEGYLVASLELPVEAEEVVGEVGANVLTREGFASAFPPVPIEVMGSPRAENGRLLISVRLPPITRSAYAADHRLLLDLGVAPREWQRVGSWPLGDWGEEARILSIPCPGLADGVLASLTLLRAQLAPLDAGSSNGS